MANPLGIGGPKKGQSLNPGGRPAKTAAIRKAEKMLRKGAPRAVERLLQLCESEDEKVAVAAIKVALGKVMADLKHEEKTGAVELTVTLNADERRAAVEVLRTLTSGADGSPPTRH